jgi:hypothetical protein
MATFVRRMLVVLSVAVAILATGSISHAVPIDGSLPLVGIGPVQDGANLAVSTTITTLDTITSGVGTADYAPVPIGTSFGAHLVDLTNLNVFSISNATFGSFVASSGLIIQQTPSFLDVFYVGTFTPGPGLAATLDPSPTSLRVSINQSGASIAESITLASPPVPPTDIPEPGTWLLLATGTIGLLGYAWQRKRQA